MARRPPRPGAAARALVSAVELAVWDDDEKLPDIRSGDMAICDITYEVSEPAEWLLLLAHEDGKLAACQPLAGDGKMRVQLKVPRKTGRRTLAASIRALDRRGVDSPLKLLFYVVGRQEEED